MQQLALCKTLLMNILYDPEAALCDTLLMNTLYDTDVILDCLAQSC